MSGWKGKFEKRPVIKPLDAGKPLAPYKAPSLPPSKFTHIEGQQFLDFSSDDPEAVCDPPAEEIGGKG